MKFVNQLAILICTFYLVISLLAFGNQIKEIDTDRSPGVGKSVPATLSDEGNPKHGKVIGTLTHNPSKVELIEIGTLSASEGALLSIENGHAVWKKGNGSIVQSNAGTYSTILLAIMTALLLVNTRFSQSTSAIS
ncbi:MAG: hypothetical protein QF752_12615 [Planctomycetota bacterium]|jgi:hypothetical protein|nr:hypothetical protein [Planctomycetota bacterium]